jgi:uncharacterized membrane protein YphA (DoxX/SURF4 family)
MSCINGLDYQDAFLPLPLAPSPSPSYNNEDSNNIINPINQSGGFFGISMEFISRLLISTFFIIMGISSAMNFSEYREIIKGTGIPYAGLFAIVSIVLQIAGGLLFTGILAIYNSVGWGKLLLILFTLVSTAVNYNAFQDSSKLEDMLKNLAILGGLLLA